MKTLSPKNAKRRTWILRFNIFLGLVVVLTALTLMITGEYSSLQELKEADKFYNYAILAGLFYMVVTWFGCVFTRPFWTSQKSD